MEPQRRHQHLHGGLPADGREPFQELVQRATGLLVLEERFHRHACPGKDRLYAQHVGVHGDRGKLVRVASAVQPSDFTSRSFQVASALSWPSRCDRGAW